MKNTGLQYRFNPHDKEVWMFWHRCMWCGQNRWDCLHHIISPSSRGHHKGEYNTSIFNSSPMHNHGCHLDNGKLHHREVEIKLLRKTMQAIKMQGYKLNDLDREFFQVYEESHYNEINNLFV